MQTESSFERSGRRPRPPFRRRRKDRHPGLAERDAPHVVPKPKGELPEAFASNVFGRVHPLIQHAVADEEYHTPTPIQEQAIPPLMEGRDLLGCAQTGTGKTAAFLLPILHKLYTDPKPVETGHPRALVLAPTRELAAQIATSVATYGRYLGLPFAVVFGGVSQFPQVQALRHGAVLVVATPGRLLDLMQQRHLDLDCVEEFVLDEADRMLDMGFLPDIRRILAKLPKQRHTQFFSATLSKEVLHLAKDLVADPVEVTIEPDKPTVDKIHQMLMFVDKPRKDALLAHLFATRPEMSRVIVFARTRHGADKIVRKLDDADIPADAIHSDKTQRARTEALSAFKRGRIRALVATDIASRGIDVDDISHVVNFDLPEETESYIHRIGRTARAGASGCAISFVSAEERGLLRAVERMIRKSIDVERVDEFHSERAEKAASSGGRRKGGEDAPPRPAWVERKMNPGANREERRASTFRDRPPRRDSGSGRDQPDFRKRILDEMDIPDDAENTSGQGRPAEAEEASGEARADRKDAQGHHGEPRHEKRRERFDGDRRRDDRPPRPSRENNFGKKPRLGKIWAEENERRGNRNFKQKPSQFRDDRPPRRFDDDRPPRRHDDDSRPPRRHDDDRPPRRFDDSRPPRRFDDSRPPRKFDGDKPPRRFDNDRPPRRFDDSRPPRRFDDDRPPRKFDSDRPPRRFDDDRPPRRFDDSRPPRRRDDDRSPRRFDDDRPPRRFDSDERPARSHDFKKGKPGKKPRFRDDGAGARKPQASHPFARFHKRKKG